VIDETEDDPIKRLNEWKDFVENRGMRVNMNKTKVMISGEWQKEMQKALRLYVVEVLVIIRRSVLVVSETWPVRKENEVALQTAEMRMVRWMCGVKTEFQVKS